jgi:hypothetical protein
MDRVTKTPHREGHPMTAHIFQQTNDQPLGKTPWPVVIEGNRVIHGRPDAVNIVGFVAVDEPHKIIVFANDELDERLMKEIEGLTPVFIGHDGGMFGVTLPVGDIRVYTGDIAALAASNVNLIETHAEAVGN